MSAHKPAAGAAPSLTHTLLALHRRLWRRTLRENKPILFNNILILVYALGLSASAAAGYIGAFEEGGDPNYIPAAMAVGMLGYALLALMLPNGELQISPERFRVYPISRRDLAPALLAAWVFQLRPWAVVICTAASMLALLLLGASWAVTVPMLIVAALSTLLVGEIAGALFASSAASEKWSKYSSLVLIVFIIGFSLLNTSDGLDKIGVIGSVVQWTPLGATGGAITAADRGDWGLAGIFALYAVVTLAAFAWAWWAMIGAQLRAPSGTSRSWRAGRARAEARSEARAESPEAGTKAGGRAQARRFVGRLLPYSPAGVIIARTWRYMRRDSRIFNQLAVYPLLGLFFLVQGVTADDESKLLFGIVLLGLLGALSGANDFGLDGPNNWVTIVSGVRPRTLLMARHAATAAVMGFSLLVYLVVVLVVVAVKDYNLAVAVLMAVAAVGMFIGSSGVALFSTVYGVYPTARPGTNAFKDRSGYSSAAMVPGLIGLFTSWIPAAPGLIMVLFGYFMELNALLIAGVVLVIAVPVVVYVVLARLAIRRFEGQLPELYQKVHSWVN